MPKSEIKTVPHFANEDEERDFWAKHDSADYVAWQKARRVKMPDLKPTTRTVSIRMPETMLEDLRMLANKRDVPYQSLLKIFVAERIEAELQSTKGAENAV